MLRLHATQLRNENFFMHCATSCCLCLAQIVCPVEIATKKDGVVVLRVLSPALEAKLDARFAGLIAYSELSGNGAGSKDGNITVERERVHTRSRTSKHFVSEAIMDSSHSGEVAGRPSKNANLRFPRK